MADIGHGLYLGVGCQSLLSAVVRQSLISYSSFFYQLVLAFVCCALFITPASTYELNGKVVKVVDGDTIYVLNDGRLAKIRLSEIDCPEKRQPYGSRAKMFTSSLAFGKEVTIFSTGKPSPLQDRYNRIIGKVFLPDGTCLNEQLLKAGLAWHYSCYSNDSALSNLEQEARNCQVGLWKDAEPIAPWHFRSYHIRRTGL